MKISRPGIAAAAGWLVLAAARCTPSVKNEIAVESLREPASPQVLAEAFDDALYCTDGRGRWDIVLHARRPAERDPLQVIEQTIHLRMFWKPIPGTTFAESSQTDAVMTYALFSGPVGISYEGAGFVFLAKDVRGELVGRIESATLLPKRRVGDAGDLLGRCRLTGRFTARSDCSRTSERIADLERRLGPRPAIAPRSDESDPR